MARVGVLALQGAFREHIQILNLVTPGLRAVEVRRPEHLEGLDGMVLPGGESTVIGKLLLEWGLLDPLRKRITAGMPVYGVCAGLILLCAEIEDYPLQTRLGVLDAAVRRNAFGRQAQSFETALSAPELGERALPAVFIRAPALTRIGPGVDVLARMGEEPVAVRQGNVLATSFHPELTKDARLHRYFADMLA